MPPVLTKKEIASVKASIKPERWDEVCRLLLLNKTMDAAFKKMDARITPKQKPSTPRLKKTKPAPLNIG